MIMRKITIFIALVAMPFFLMAQENKKPNILVLFGDDIGIWNISHNNEGMMGYQTPNIDRIADEGIKFTDYYGQQSCTAGRAAFIGGTNPLRTGMTKVGAPGMPEGWQESDITIAAVMKDLGYRTGQFGKNHLGDLDTHLPTNHGFDEFFGNLYHLDAEEEPEDVDYPKDPEFRKKYGPRGVVHSYADGKIEDTGPLTKKRMETIDDETSAAAIEFIRNAVKAGEPFFVWWNGTRMHFRTHVKKEHQGISGQNFYADGMVEHDMHVGVFLDLLDELGIAGNTLVLYTTDNGPHVNAWPDAATTPFRSEKNTNWEGAFRVPAFVRWPGHFKENTILNGIVAHEDWLPTFAAIAGEPTINEKVKQGAEINGRFYKNYLDGYNMLDYLTGKTNESPRHQFIYVSDDGDVIAIRLNDWKAVYYEQRAQTMNLWREPFVKLRLPLLFNLRRDPFEKAQHNSNSYNEWYLEKVYQIYPMPDVALEFFKTLSQYPPSQVPGDFSLENLKKFVFEMNPKGTENK